MSERGQTLYDLLEVRHDASPSEIEQSYRGMLAYLGAGSLAMYSMMEEDEIATLRIRVEEAYETLRDPERRAAYDRSLSTAHDNYPSLLIPESLSDTHVTVGHVVSSASERTNTNVSRSAAPELPFVRPVPTSPTPAAVVASNLAPASIPVGLPVVGATNPESMPVTTTPAPAVSSASPLPTGETLPARVASVPAAVAPAPVAADTVAPAFEPPAAVEKIAPLPFGGTPAITPRPWTPPPPTQGPRVVKKLAPKPDVPLTAETEFTGALLRRLRESANASLDDMCEITKVGKRYLRAIEDGDFEALPAAVYVRGFVVEYARALGLDPNQVSKSFMGLYRRFKGEGG